MEGSRNHRFTKHRGGEGTPRTAALSVVVVNSNGGQATVDCVRSLLESDPLPSQIVIVDNGSSDDSLSLFEEFRCAPVPVRVIALPDNIGVAAGRNIGAERATSPVLAFLDNDTVVDPDWIRAGLEVMRNFEVDCVQCKLLLKDSRDRLDSLGYLAGPFGFPKHIVRPGVPDTPELARPRLLFGVKGAGFLITREMFSTSGAFDPSFFIYGEETDLSWRVLRRGGRIALAPGSWIFHGGGGTKRFLPESFDELLYRFGTRNYILLVMKNQYPRRVVIDVIGQVIIWSGVAMYHVFRLRLRPAFLVVRGIADALEAIPRARQARRATSLPYRRIPEELREPFNLKYLLAIVRAL